MKKNNHTTLHKGFITKEDRNSLNRHDSGVIWFTGLSASGKSTIAHEIEKRLYQNGIRVFVFDGDNIRHGLNSDISSPFEEPDSSDIVIDTQKTGIEEAVSKVLDCLQERDFLSPLCLPTETNK
jgi:adenylylsulfate kinase-like enzyme